MGSVGHGEAASLELLNVHCQEVGRGQGRLGPEAPSFHQTQAVALQEYLATPGKVVGRERQRSDQPKMLNSVPMGAYTLWVHGGYTAPNKYSVQNERGISRLWAESLDILCLLA